MSAQSRHLHRRCIAAAVRVGAGSFIGRAAATVLADECGALMDELVEVGYWREGDVGYRLATADTGSP